MGPCSCINVTQLYRVTHMEIKQNDLILNPIQAGGGGTLCPPYRFFPAVPKRLIVD